MSVGVSSAKLAVAASRAAPPAAQPDVAAEKLRVLMMTDARGVHDFPGIQRVVVCAHVGPAADVACRRGGESHRGKAVHGDVDIIPAGMPSRWENQDQDTVLVMSLAPEVVRDVVENAGRDPRRVAISNRFQVRDAPMEHLAWALKAEMDGGFPCGRLFLEGMATALAAQLVHRHSSMCLAPRLPRGGMPVRRLKHVLSFIDDNLAADISLDDIAQVAGISVSHCKTLFRRSVGQPVYQYVIRRRVEWAARLLREGALPISQVALETGFSHQSHLARHMRRLLGVSPRSWKDAAR